MVFPRLSMNENLRRGKRKCHLCALQVEMRIQDIDRLLKQLTHSSPLGFIFHWEPEIQAFTLSDILADLNSQPLRYFIHWVS